GREAHVRVAGARIAIDASMAASPIGVDGLLEGNVRRIVRGDYAACAIRLEHRGDAVGLFLDVPAVVDGLQIGALEAPTRIGEGAPALESLRSHGFAAHKNPLYAHTVQP